MMDRKGIKNDESAKPTVVQKMCQYICCCFTCLQRPDESKTEYNQVEMGHLSHEMKERGQLAGQFRAANTQA